jgi:hypothetical protein
VTNPVEDLNGNDKCHSGDSPFDPEGVNPITVVLVEGTVVKMIRAPREGMLA